MDDRTDRVIAHHVYVTALTGVSIAVICSKCGSENKSTEPAVVKDGQINIPTELYTCRQCESSTINYQ